MSFNFKRGEPYKQFLALEPKDQRFLVRFSVPWDVEYAIEQNINLHKMAELIRQCYQQKLARDNAQSRKENNTPKSKKQKVPKMSIKLKFLRPEKAKRTLFMLDDNMIKILKSDLKADRAAKIVNEGMSFKKLALLVKRGSNMQLMNRLVENKSSPLNDTLRIIEKTGEPNDTIRLLTRVGQS